MAGDATDWRASAGMTPKGSARRVASRRAISARSLSWSVASDERLDEVVQTMRPSRTERRRASPTAPLSNPWASISMA